MMLFIARLYFARRPEKISYPNVVLISLDDRRSTVLNFWYYSDLRSHAMNILRIADIYFEVFDSTTFIASFIQQLRNYNMKIKKYF